MNEAGSMRCASCGAFAPAGGRFCIHCGAPADRSCPSRGEAIVPGARFCPYCGAPVDSDVIDILSATGRVFVAEELLVPLEFTIPIVAGQVARARGLMHLKRGEPDGAEAELREAVRTLRTVEHPFALARTLLTYAGCLEELGRSSEATPLRQEARTLLERLGAIAWQERSGAPSAAV